MGSQQRLQVIEQGGAGGDRLRLSLQCEQGGAIELWRELGQQVTAIAAGEQGAFGGGIRIVQRQPQHEAVELRVGQRSEEHTSELQSLMRRSYAVFCLNKT